jgi:dipeptidyl-peptidase-3
MGKCFLEAGDDFCKLDYKNEDLSDLPVKLDRSRIMTVGRKAVNTFCRSFINTI